MRTLVKKVLKTFLFFLLLQCSVSCKNKSGPEKEIVGRWRLVRLDSLSLTGTWKIDIKPNGTLQFEDIPTRGTWSLFNDTFNFVTEDIQGYKEEGMTIIKISNDTLYFMPDPWRRLYEKYKVRSEYIRERY